jgi:hypothetical protein
LVESRIDGSLENGRREFSPDVQRAVIRYWIFENSPSLIPFTFLSSSRCSYAAVASLENGRVQD